MKNPKLILSGAIIILATAAVTVNAYAGKGDHDANINDAQISLQNAVEIALNNTPGKVIEAELESDDNRLAWEIELSDLSNQKYEFLIDANTGEILEKELDD